MDHSSNDSSDKERKSIKKEDKIDDHLETTLQQGEPKGCGDYFLMGLFYFLLFLIFPITPCITIKIVNEYTRAVILRLGRIASRNASGPGLFCVVPCSDEFTTVDLRVQTFDVPPQEVLTKDSVSITVDAVVFYRIVDPVKSVINVHNVAEAAKNLGQTTLRNVIGSYDLHGLITKSNTIKKIMKKQMDLQTSNWGARIERVEIQDIRLPINLQRSMAAQAEATREAKAKVIAAGGERRAAKSLRLAGDEMSKSPVSLQLRFLQTLSTIATGKHSTVIFPFPLSHFGDMNAYSYQVDEENPSIESEEIDANEVPLVDEIKIEKKKKKKEKKQDKEKLLKISSNSDS